MRFTLGTWLAAAMICLGRGLAYPQPATNQHAGVSAISLAPYLQALSPEEVVVQWETEEPAYGWVEYGETTDLGLKRDAVVHGLRVANVKHHRIVLRELRPGTAYWYRVRFKPILSFGAYQVAFGPEQGSEATQFRTLPGPGRSVRAIVFNDLHNNLSTFRSLCRVLGDAPFDFSIFNGDCLADPEKEDRVLASVAAFNQGAHAGSRPAFFIRGNHETRGAFARRLPELLTWPGGKPYFAFNCGPIRFVVLDCGEDKPDNNREYSGLVDFESFRREETVWLKNELDSAAFREATWRVLVHHIPLDHSIRRASHGESSQATWVELLGKAGIDLALNAHLHRMAFHPANSIGNPYPLIVGGGNKLEQATVMVLEADEQRLKVQVFNAEGKEALPAFEKRK